MNVSSFETVSFCSVFQTVPERLKDKGEFYEDDAETSRFEFNVACHHHVSFTLFVVQ